MLQVIDSFNDNCNGKSNCRIVPSYLNLADCGGLAASYLHVDYVCSKSNLIKNNNSKQFY